MTRSIPLILGLSSIPLGLMLISYALDRREKREEPAPSPIASSEKTWNSAVSQDASEQAVQSSRDQDGAVRATQSGREPDSGEPYSLVQQPPQEGTRAEPTPNILAEVVAAHAGRKTDIGVVGRPFPVSQSVVEACKPVRPGIFRSDACDRVNELLIEMAKEPRDEVWATATERLLRAYAEEEPGKFTIRALECRKSICFIETASIFDNLPDPGYRFLRNHGLKKEYPVDVHETDGSGTRLTVTLFPFMRI